MLKRLILIAAILSCATIVWGDVDEFIGVATVDEYCGVSTVDEVAGQTVASGGPARGDTLESEDFEGMNDGDEIDDDAQWTEVPARTNIQVCDDDDLGIAPNGGTKKMWAEHYAGYTHVYDSFTAQSSGYIAFEFFYAQTDAGEGYLFKLCDGAPTTTPADNQHLIALRIQSDNKLEIYDDGDGGSWSDIDSGADCTMTDNTWVRIEGDMNIDDADGQDAVRIWCDGVLADAGPFDVINQQTSTEPDIYALMAPAEAGDDMMFDDVLIYDGERVAP